ncbi:MAG: hypothetical protein ACKVH8_19830 [Pirellulales bacterium]
MSKMLNALRRLEPSIDFLSQVPDSGLKVQSKLSAVAAGQSNVSLIVEPELPLIPRNRIAKENAPSNPTNYSPIEKQLSEQITALESQLEKANQDTQSKTSQLEQVEQQVLKQEEKTRESKSRNKIKSQEALQASQQEIQTLKQALTSVQLESNNLSQVIDKRTEELETTHSQLHTLNTQSELKSQQTIAKISELESLVETLQDQATTPTFVVPELRTVPATAPSHESRNNKQIQSSEFESAALLDIEKNNCKLHYAGLTSNLLYNCKSKRQITLLLVDVDSPGHAANLAIRLALSFSKMMSKVLLIDAATESNPLTKGLNYSNQPGLRETLVKNADWTENRVKLALSPMHFLSSGKYTFSMSTEHKQATQQLLNKASEHYDLVIIAAGSARAASTQIFASAVDAVYLSACLGQAQAASISAIAQNLNSQGAKIEGMIATNVPKWCYT